MSSTSDLHPSPTNDRRFFADEEDRTPKARTVILSTPPLILNTFPSATPRSHLQSVPSFDDCSDHTPTSLDHQFDPLEPPAWKPPEQSEIDYVDSWNNTFNNPHHYLNGYSYKDNDASTTCSSGTNNSPSKSFNSRDRPFAQQVLRPRGYSTNSYGSATKGAHFRHPSFGSCPQHPPRKGNGHHRHDSLPVALFSSGSMHSALPPLAPQPQTQQQVQQHPLLNQPQQDKRINSRAYHMLSKGQINSNHSQIKADATMAGLHGALIDVYTVDRCVDEATAKMLAVKQNDGRCSRKTCMGTLQDVQTILELHKVDKMVDRFKFGLQMPEFFEEEEKDVAILKELRGVDLLIGGIASSDNKNTNVSENAEKQHQYQFDFSEDDEEEEELCGDIYLSTDSFQTDTELDPYQFIDPHELVAMEAHIRRPTSQDDLDEVMDLLRTDVEIDGASRRKKELVLVQPMLEVDQSVDRWREMMEKKRCEREMMDLYLVDVEVDRARRVGVKKNSSDLKKMTVPSASHLPSVTPEPLKRSIFRHRDVLNSSSTETNDAADNVQANTGSKRSIFTEQEKIEAMRRSQGHLG